jgi:hypothetical protein
MTIDITQIVVAVIGALATAVTGIVIPWLLSKIKSEKVRAAIDTAIHAAEQLAKSGAITDKLQYAQNYLAQKGITADAAQIEAAVNKAFNAKREESDEK